MNTPKNTSHFLCRYEELTTRLDNIDPVRYAKTRNYLDGAVTWLSPFITHGVINTVDVANAVRKSHSLEDCYQLLYELAWREYFHRVWESNRSNIFSDMRGTCPSTRTQIPQAIISASSGVHIIDDAVKNLVDFGFMHNHARMWVAAICCNMGNTHWLPAAKWMHYHLLDGDLASNTLSWQWVAGTFSHKRYLANQANINRFSKTHQQGTFLDVSYEQLAEFKLPTALIETGTPSMPQSVPGIPVLDLANLSGTVALRSVWHLDAQWRPDVDHHIVFIDNEQLHQWPMSQNRWQFIQHWADFIPNLRIAYGTVEQLQSVLSNNTVFLQSYPASDHWAKATDDRTWLYPKPKKEYNSFSQFWKQVKQHCVEK